MKNNNQHNMIQHDMNYHNSKIIIWNIITGIVAILLLISSLFFSLWKVSALKFSDSCNEVRQQLNPDRIRINQLYIRQMKTDENNIYPKLEYPYMIIDQTGLVVYADENWEYQTGDQVSIEEMIQQDKSFLLVHKDQEKFTFVLSPTETDRNSCIGYLVFLIPEKMLAQGQNQQSVVKCFMPLIGAIVIICILILFRTYYCNKRILKPLHQIHQSADAIIAGNYDIEVHRVLDSKLQVNEIGNLIYSFEMMRDELKAKQKSENALKKSQQELISCISHDLRTPISTIRAYSEGMRDGIATNEKERQEYLKIIIHKTVLLEKMISELLEYSNTQLKQMSVIKKDVYLNEYLKDILHELKGYVTQNKIEFQFTLTPEEVMVSIDSRRITEVLYNLIENSMKYIGDGPGKISVYTKRNSEYVEIHVKDNGIGISADDIPYVFDKFYRAEKSRSSNITGSGLGLSICRYIVNEHGGEIYCNSSKSMGSEFWFTIPI